MLLDLIRVQNSCTGRNFGEKNVIIFGVDISSNVHIDNNNNNNNNDNLIFGKRPTQLLDDTTLTAEAKYPINFSQSGKRFVYSLHYNGRNSFLLVNATKLYQFITKDSEVKDYALCLGKISKNFTINDMKKNMIKKNCKIFFCWFSSY